MRVPLSGMQIADDTREIFDYLWIPQIPSVTNAIEISDMRKGTGGWVKKATGK